MVLRSAEVEAIDLVLDYVKSGIAFGLIVLIISAILEAIATAGCRHDPNRPPGG
jgi:hypothetical protein